MKKKKNLLPTSTDDGNRSRHLTTAATEALDFLDDLKGRLVSNLAEDDVLAVQPRGDDGGDEELRSVAVVLLVLVN